MSHHGQSVYNDSLKFIHLSTRQAGSHQSQEQPLVTPTEVEFGQLIFFSIYELKWPSEKTYHNSKTDLSRPQGTLIQSLSPQAHLLVDGMLRFMS